MIARRSWTRLGPTDFGRRGEDGAEERLAIEHVPNSCDGRLAGCERSKMRWHRSGEGEEAGRRSDQQHDQEWERHRVSRQPGTGTRREPCFGCGDDAVDGVEEDGQRQLEGLVHVIGAADELDVVEADEDRCCANQPIVHGDRPRSRRPRGEVPDRQEHQHDRSAGCEDVVSVPSERGRSLSFAERHSQPARKLVTRGEGAVVEDEVVESVL